MVIPLTGRRRNHILIPKNTPLPHTVTKVFKTQKEGQNSVVIRVVEGESERPEACTLVGVCTLTDLLKVRRRQLDLERLQSGLRRFTHG